MRKILQSSPTHVLFAFCAMGSWALFANRGHPMPKPVYAGLVQGLMSAIITYFLKRTIEALQTRFNGPSALWLPPLIAASAGLVLLVTVHTLAGTPEVLKTIALPFGVAATYAAIYNYIVYKQRGIPRGE